MAVANQCRDSICRERLEQFFGSYRDAALHRSALTAMRFLTACDEPLLGKPEGWAAGNIYALANRGRRACGVPGVLNSGFEEFFGISMGTIRKQAAQVDRLLALQPG
jgi:hypothetical protein